VLTGFWLGDPEVGGLWEDLGLAGRIRWILGRQGSMGVSWIRLAQDRVQWQAFLSTVMNLQVP